jgi:hypothetical protein
VVKTGDEKYAVAAIFAAELLGDDYTGVCLPGDDCILAAFSELPTRLRNFTTLKNLIRS